MTIKAQTGPGAPLELHEREQSLLDRYPAIPWTAPRPATVGGRTRLTCRFCTALYGLKAWDLDAGRTGFDTAEEHKAHLREVHAGPLRAVDDRAGEGE